MKATCFIVASNI